MADVTALADRLAAAVAERTAIAPLSDDVADLGTGYAVQRVLRERAGGRAGWKVGLTSRPGGPVFGFLPGDAALDIGEPLGCGALIAPRAEPEIVFVLGRDLAGAHVTASDVLAATEGVAAGIEIVDSRYTHSTVADVVADNASAARFLVGAPVSPAGIDLRLVGVLLEHNGELVATASGAASLGHPAAAVAWLARRLAATDEGLAAGEIVLSGGLAAPIPVRPGDVVAVTVDRLGTVELACGA